MLANTWREGDVCGEGEEGGGGEEVGMEKG